MPPLSTFDMAMSVADMTVNVLQFSKNSDHELQTVRHSRINTFIDQKDFAVLIELPSDFISFKAFKAAVTQLSSSTGIETLSFLLKIFKERMASQKRAINSKLKAELIGSAINHLHDTISKMEEEMGISETKVHTLQATIFEKNELIEDLSKKPSISFIFFLSILLVFFYLYRIL